MTAIARDAVAAAQLVYAWPFPIGPECTIKCADDEFVVMCPAWLVGDRLGPGHHHWRTPDPTRPSSAYFVLTAPVEVPFDMTTTFSIPTSGQRVRLHAAGSLQVRCADAQLLVAQFVGLPFDDVNGSILRSVSRSVERMLARLLTRRVVLAASANVVTEPQNQAAIIEELVAYNPAAGAVFGVEMIRMGRLTITADDGNGPLKTQQTQDFGRVGPNGDRPATPRRRDDVPLLETVRGRPASMPPIPKPDATPASGPTPRGNSPSVPPPTASAAPSGDPPRKKTPIMGVPELPKAPTVRATPSSGSPIVSSSMNRSASGEIALPGARTTAQSMPAIILSADEPTPAPAVPPVPIGQSGIMAAVEPPPVSPPPAPPPPPAPAAPVAVSGEISAPPTRSKKSTLSDGSGTSGEIRIDAKMREAIEAEGGVSRKANGGDAEASRGSIMGIGMSAIGEVKGGSSVVGEIQKKVAPGSRVLVPGPNGLMQSATVRQLLQGYYELEVGSTGQTIWVPMAGVVPEP